jgi:hypothetical protein
MYKITDITGIKLIFENGVKISHSIDNYGYSLFENKEHSFGGLIDEISQIHQIAYRDYKCHHNVHNFYFLKDARINGITTITQLIVSCTYK